MSSDSTELTFVRCPACRSLVPAMSKTCRMCGAGLDANAKVDDTGDRKSGRVRQRTMSKPEEMSSAVNRIREEMGHETSPGGAHTSVSAMEAAVEEQPTNPGSIPMPFTPTEVEGGDLEDPLSAYIEEVEVPPVVPTPPKAPTEPAQNGKNGAHWSESPIRSGPKGPGARPPSGELSSRDVKGFAPVESKPSVGLHDEPIESEELEQEQAPKPRVIVESGPRKFNRGGLSFGGKGREESPKREDPKPAPEAEAPSSVKSSGFEPPSFKGEKRTEAPAPQHTSKGRVENPERREDEKRAPRREERRSDSRDDRREEPREERVENKGAHGEVQKEGERARSIEVPRRSVNSGGRLAGWLVNTPEGGDSRAVELREGKFFITRTRVKDSDLVIDDRSISTPHALCAVGIESKMRIQDLMSDGGVYVRRRGESEFIRITETAELDHGDWIRFGTMEYNVCLIAHVGVK